MKKILGIFALMVFMTSAINTVKAQTIFLGKGDVQTVLGLNNAKMNDLVLNNGLTFKYESEDRYEIVAEWWTGPDRNRTYHTISVPRTISVSVAIAYEARKNANSPLQITGFWLTFGNVTSGDVPQVGNNFNDGNDVKTIISVDFVSTSGGLFANGYLIPTFVLPTLVL